MNKQSKNILSIALELYFQKYGAEEYGNLIEKIKSKNNDESLKATNILKTFIDENIDHLQEESIIENISNSSQND